MRVSVIGLGAMGAGMAASVLRAGLATTVWNRSPEKSEPLRDQGAEVAATAAEAVADADVVVVSLFDEASVQDAVARAAERGPLRVAVNCAGIGTPGRVLGRKGPLALDAFARVVQVNLVGTFNVLRLAAAAIAETGPVDGERGVVDLIGIVAYYQMASMLLNVDRYPLPAGVKPELTPFP